MPHLLHSFAFILTSNRKSTLLKVLTLQAFGGTSNGVVQLNGNDLNFNRFRKDFAFVEQHDTLWSYLSVVEHLECAANMYLANDPLERRKSMVQELLETLGLDGALTTKAHALSGRLPAHGYVLIAHRVYASQISIFLEPNCTQVVKRGVYRLH